MGILNAASGKSVWHGYDYFNNNRVISCEQTGETEFVGKVRGSRDYEVKIDYKHPRKSVCNCPQANGKRVVCKHMVALYFAVFPMEADILLEQNGKWEQAEEDKNKKVYSRVSEYIDSMSAEQAKNELYSLLMDSPEWVFDRFVRDHGMEDLELPKESIIDGEQFKRLTQEVCDCIEMSDGEMTFYYDKKGKEIILDSEYLDDNIEDFDGDDLLRLPDKHDFGEYEVMKDFAQRQTGKIRQELLIALSGKGAYGKFKDILIKFGIEKYWYAYRDECIRIFAENWCCKNIIA